MTQSDKAVEITGTAETGQGGSAAQERIAALEARIASLEADVAILECECTALAFGGTPTVNRVNKRIAVLEGALKGYLLATTGGDPTLLEHADKMARKALAPEVKP